MCSGVHTPFCAVFRVRRILLPLFAPGPPGPAKSGLLGRPPAAKLNPKFRVGVFLKMNLPAGLLREALPLYTRFLGVCGSICSGKSSCRSFLSQQPHVVCVDADSLGHAAYAPGGPTHAAVAALFPAALQADGTLDRRAIGARVFGDAAALAALNAVVWPAISALAVAEFRRRGEEAAAASAAAGAPPPPLVGVLEAAVLAEAGWAPHFDAVWLLRCSEAAALARLAARGVDAAGAAARLAAQPRAEEREQRLRAAHPALPLAVFDTSGPPEGTRAAYAAAFARLAAPPQ
jgi:dephospho-CoA kinase